MSHSIFNIVQDNSLCVAGDIAFRFMDYCPLGKREVTICDVNAKMLRHGQKKAARQGYTKGTLILADICYSGVRYSNFSYHDIGAISITIRYISRYNLWFEITMKHYYEVNKLSRKFGI